MEGFGYEKKIRIMIVDENAEFRSYTANKLREEGFDVVLTTSDPKMHLMQSKQHLPMSFFLT